MILKCMYCPRIKSAHDNSSTPGTYICDSCRKNMPRTLSEAVAEEVRPRGETGRRKRLKISSP